jgi:hypothetical protein
MEYIDRWNKTQGGRIFPEGFLLVEQVGSDLKKVLDKKEWKPYLHGSASILFRRKT